MPNYGFNVIWSDEDEAYVATCPAFPDLSAFGESPEEALEEGRVVLGLFIEEYEADAVPLPEPTTLSQYSGRCLVRMSKSLHATLAALASQEGVSLNQLMVQTLSMAVGGAAVSEVYIELLGRAFESLGHHASRNLVDYIRAQVSATETESVNPFQDPILNRLVARADGSNTEAG